MIKLINLITEEEVQFSKWLFPGGEVGVRITEPVNSNTVYQIQVLKPTSEELFILANLADALAKLRIPKSNISVHLPYVPYGRQDRVCHTGESYALSVFASFFKAIAYWDKVYIEDPHSNSTYCLLESRQYDLIVINQGDRALGLPTYDYLIAPDKGASVKLRDHHQIVNAKAIPLFMNKVRTDSGVKHEPLQDNIIVGTACIVDDICDGGATFLSVGNMLRQNQPRMTQLDLYVTHGLFSKGTSELDKLFDNIYTANNFNPSATSVKVI